MRAITWKNHPFRNSPGVRASVMKYLRECDELARRGHLLMRDIVVSTIFYTDAEVREAERVRRAGLIVED